MSEERTKPSLTLYFLNIEDRDSFLEQINSIKFESGDYYEVKDAPFVMYEKDVDHKRDIAVEALKKIEVSASIPMVHLANNAIKKIEDMK